MKEFWHLLTPWQKFKFVLSLLLAVFTGIFAVINWQEAEINFVFFKIRLSITLLIAICLVVGYLSSMIFDYKKYREKEREISKLKEEIEALKHKH